LCQGSFDNCSNLCEKSATYTVNDVTPPPRCDNGTTFRVYDINGTDITSALRNKTRPLYTNERLTVGAIREEASAVRARFRLRPYDTWVYSDRTVTVDGNTEFRATLPPVPANFNGTQGSLEAELCDANNVCN